MKDQILSEHVAEVETYSPINTEKVSVLNDENVALETRIRHKFDRRILVLGTLIYLFAQIDRSNMSNAVVLGE